MDVNAVRTQSGVSSPVSNDDEALKQESHFIQLGQDRLHLKRFYTQANAPVVFMLHGSMSSGRIFYSLKNKGLAPYLAKQGYDVFVADLHGRGQSSPAISRASKNSQYDAITQEIPAFLNYIQQLTHTNHILAVAHSWGGVMLQAYIARTPQHPITRLVCLGSKRSIAWKNLKKLLPVDLAWSALGELACLYKGYMPAKALKMGSDNETANMFRQSRYWVYTHKKWIDPVDGFNYIKAFKSHPKKADTLHLAAINDPYLGHPHDVAVFKHELHNPNDRFMVLSKANGNAKDYNHIDICTAPEAETDHFSVVVQWLRQ